jgi:hypothetical protein
LGGATVTRIIYEDANFVFETNGDGSAIQLNFASGQERLVAELRAQLKKVGWRVVDHPQDNVIRLVVNPDLAGLLWPEG